MTKLVLLDSRLYVGGADLSGQGNKIEMSEEWEAKSVTNWRSGGATEVIAGLGKVAANASGQWEAGDPGLVDDAMWASRRVIEPWTVSGTGESDLTPGSLMYLTKMLRTRAMIWGGLGEVAGWSATAAGSWPLVRGQAAHASGVPRTATGTGTPLQLGALTSVTQAMYANLHVLSVSGTSTPSIAVTVQSAPTNAFSSPTTRATFGTKTAISGEALRIAGPVTDTWWRVGWTITGLTPSFLFLASLGIE